MSASERLVGAVAQIRAADGQVVGAGFAVTGGALLTCAHVVDAAGSGPGQSITVAFRRHAAGESQPTPGSVIEVVGTVLIEQWRAPDEQDIAVIALPGLPIGATTVAAGSAEGCRGRRLVSFGFPAQAPDDGHYGYAVAGDVLFGRMLQLADANDLTTGFSGAPVVDEATGLVVGMLTEITKPDVYQRGVDVAYATPAETLRQVWPALVESSSCPYRGLDVFTTEHRAWFRGRKQAVRLVLEALRGSPRALLLLGPSGAGKSSLMRAGVLPAIADGALPGSDDWITVVVRPGQDLLAELDAAGLTGAPEDGITKAALGALARHPGTSRVLIVIDQFEELLAPAPTLMQRTAIEQLTSALCSTEALGVVFVLRDDFYARLAAALPGMLEAVAPSTVNVPPTVHRDELREMIVEPAQASGLDCQDGLPARIIADVCGIEGRDGIADHAPTTALPLLELTLQQLWRRRRDGRLTHDAYDAIGGVAGSISTWCNTATAQLTKAQRPVARRLLTALVQPADLTQGVPAVRRQVPVANLRELATVDGRSSRSKVSVEDVLDILTATRIVTVHAAWSTSQDTSEEYTAELIHDSLISAWATLREWVRQDHAFQDWLRRAQGQHARWLVTPVAGELMQGSMLAEGVEWSGKRRLPSGVAQLLEASKHADRRRRRRVGIVISALAAAVILVLIVSSFAVWQKHTADAAHRLALAKQLISQSTALRTTNSDLAALLAVHAYQLEPTSEAASDLYTAAPPLRHSMLPGAPGTVGTVTSASFGYGGQRLLTGVIDGSAYYAHQWSIGAEAERIDWPAWPGNERLYSVAADGRTMATAALNSSDSNPTRVTLRDTETGTVRATLRGVRPSLGYVVFSRNGRDVLTASRILASNNSDLQYTETDSWEIAKWDASSGAAENRFSIHIQAGSIGGDRPGQSFNPHVNGAEEKFYGFQSGGTPMAVSPDGQTLAFSADSGDVQLRDLTNGRLIMTLKGHMSAVTDLKFAPDGRTMASASFDHTVRLWSVATGATLVTLPKYSESPVDLAFSPDGHTLAIAGSDGTLRLWDTVAEAETVIWASSTRYPRCVSFSPDGDTLAMCLDDTVWLWNTDHPTSRKPLDQSRIATTAVAFSVDRKILATGSDGRPLENSTSSSQETSGVDWSPDNARIWNLPSGSRHANLASAPSSPVTAVSISPDGNTLACGYSDGTIQLWDTDNGALIQNLVGPEAEPSAWLDTKISALAFSPDGRFIGSGSAANTITLWDRQSRHIARMLVGPKAPTATLDASVTSIAFAGRGDHTLAAASRDGTVELWDTANGRLRKVLTTDDYLDGVNAVAFSPDSKLLASAGDDHMVRLWDPSGTTPPLARVGHTDNVLTLAFAPDGRTLASGSSDQTIRIWDVGTAITRRVLPSQSHAVVAVAYTRDGQDLVTVTADAVVSAWHPDLPGPAGTIASICQAIGRDLTAQEQRQYLPKNAYIRVCKATY